MADVFISYKREDRENATQFADFLRQHGLTVFFDADIPVGDSWDQFIERELIAASVVVVLWSERSVASRWVRLEARHALQRGVLVPILLEACAIPLEFQDIQAAPLSLGVSADREKFLTHIRRLCAVVGDGEGQRIYPTTPPAPRVVTQDSYVNSLNYGCAICEALSELLSSTDDEDVYLQIDRTVSQLKRAVGLIDGACDADDSAQVGNIRENVWQAAEVIADSDGALTPRQMREAKALVDEAAAEICYLIGFKVQFGDSESEEE